MKKYYDIKQTLSTILEQHLEDYPHQDALNKTSLIDELIEVFQINDWVAYDWERIESRPTQHGKYFIHRKDGKVHWETWNGSGWAYNGKVITHWMSVLPPRID